MLFVRQERLLRISHSKVVEVYIYVQQQNVEWFTDALLQEMLQAIRPKLPEKFSEHSQGKQAPSILKNRAFQMAYFINKGVRSSHVLIQEPTAEHNDTAEDMHESQFSYTALSLVDGALILVPEPFDPNNSVALPEIFEANQLSSSNL